MPRKIIKRYLPDHKTVREHKSLKLFGSLLHDPNLWHLNRRSVSGAFSVGLFTAFMPIPFQMLLAAAIAIPARVNLPIAVTLVWVTNPFTMGPIFYFAYKIGSWVLQTPIREFTFELSFAWLMGELGAIWEPFLFGCFLLGILSAVAGNIAMRLFWRLHIFKYVKRRRLRRQINR